MSAAVAEVETPASGQPKAGNLSVGELGALISKGRKAAAAPKEEANPAASEQAGEESETKTELEQAAEAEQGEADETETEQAAAKPEGVAEVEADEDKAGAEGDAKQAKAKAVTDLQKRVHKVVDQRDSERNGRLAAERELADLKAQMATGAGKPATNGAGVNGAEMNEQFAGDAEVVALDKTLSQVEAFLDFAAKHPDGGSFEDNGKTYELDADQMRAFKSKSEKERIRLSSKREARLESKHQAFMTERAEAHTEAVKLYPWIENKASAEFQEAIRLIQKNPGVMAHADFELIVARQVAGQRLETEARKKLGNGNLKPGGSRIPAPVVTHAAAAAPKAAPGTAKAKAVEEQFKSSGKVNDLATLLAERKRARMQPA